VKTTTAFVIGLALAGSTSLTHAQNARSFVSAHGSDAAACTLVAPCRTLAAAFAATNAGGEIDVLDPAGYGSLTINKAISIVNDGVGTAGVIVPSGNLGVGITINAGSNDAVSLRGLSIEGAGVGGTGIIFNSGASLTVENCVIRHMTSNGIYFVSTSASALTVSNSLVADNGSAGIFLNPHSTATAVFNRVEITNNQTFGIFLSGDSAATSVDATVSESIVSGNGATGLVVSSQSVPTNLMVFHSVAANNGIGIGAVGSNAAILRLANSAVTGNKQGGWSVISFDGVIASYGDNYIDGNGQNLGSLTPISKQ
jgi:Right handed beta helix region